MLQSNNKARSRYTADPCHRWVEDASMKPRGYLILSISKGLPSKLQLQGSILCVTFSSQRLRREVGTRRVHTSYAAMTAGSSRSAPEPVSAETGSTGAPANSGTCFNNLRCSISTTCESEGARYDGNDTCSASVPPFCFRKQQVPPSQPPCTPQYYMLTNETTHLMPLRRRHLVGLVGHDHQRATLGGDVCHETDLCTCRRLATEHLAGKPANCSAVQQPS